VPLDLLSAERYRSAADARGSVATEASVRCNGGFGSSHVRMDRTVMSTHTLTDLVAAFRALALSKEDWTHLAHLRVGAWHVHHFGFAAALEMLRAGIRRLNDFHGTSNSTSSGYHETITVAYARLIEQFLSSFEVDVPVERRVDLLTESPLAERSVLLRFWSRDLLMSPRARAEWVPPDLAPLAVPLRALPRIGP
jgi:hypothetical protein